VARPLFIDPARQAEFEERGWTTLRVFSGQDVQDLREFYFSLPRPAVGRSGFYVGLDAVDRGQVSAVRDRIRSLFLSRAAGQLAEPRAFTASFVVKEPDPKGVVPPHQDWSFTDEPSYSSATVWIPLQDVDARNGALGVISGSHKIFRAPRLSPSPEAKSAIADHLHDLMPWVRLVELKAGEGIAFHNSTIHASPPNAGTEPRIAVGVGITQKEAPLLHYYQVPGTEPAEMTCFEVDEEFFAEYTNTRLSELYRNGEIPQGYPVRERIPRNLPKYTTAGIIESIRSFPGNTRNPMMVDEMHKVIAGGPLEAPAARAEKPVSAHPRERVYTVRNVLAEIRWRLSQFLHQTP
jgi:hypothetical protein